MANRAAKVAADSGGLAQHVLGLSRHAFWTCALGSTLVALAAGLRWWCQFRCLPPRQASLGALAHAIEPIVVPSICTALSAMVSLFDVSDLIAPHLFIFLRPVDSARLGCAHKLLQAALAPRAVLPRLAALLGSENHMRTARGLGELLRQPQGATQSAAVDAVFADALRHGGDLDCALRAPDLQGRPPLLLAVQRQLPAAAQALLDLSAAPDAGDVGSGWSPLMFAISSGHQVMAELLVARGASVNLIARPHGYTPVMAALGMGNEPLVEWLLDCGADPLYTLKVLHSNLSHHQKEHETLKRVLDRRPRRPNSKLETLPRPSLVWPEGARPLRAPAGQASDGSSSSAKS